VRDEIGKIADRQLEWAEKQLTEGLCVGFNSKTRRVYRGRAVDGISTASEYAARKTKAPPICSIR